MSRIRNERVALDSNAYIFGVRTDPAHPGCAAILRDHLDLLSVFVPLQVQLELQSNLSAAEMHELYALLADARELAWNYEPPPAELVGKYEMLGAKKGDARICAELDQAAVGWLVSENRDFLHGIRELPFGILSAEEAVAALRG